jgi:hypothetical protein
MYRSNVINLWEAEATNPLKRSRLVLAKTGDIQIERVW